MAFLRITQDLYADVTGRPPPILLNRDAPVSSRPFELANGADAVRKRAELIRSLFERILINYDD